MCTKMVNSVCVVLLLFVCGAVGVDGVGGGDGSDAVAYEDKMVWNRHFKI